MNLTGLISFNVGYDFTGIPSLKLTASTSIPDADKPNLTGYFIITQPDGITTTSGIAIVWNGSGYPTYTVPLRLASDQSYQKGIYTIKLVAQCIGYTDGQFTRSFDMEYKSVIQTLQDNFDLFTPALRFIDTTIYGVRGYSITGQTSSWNATSAAGAIFGTSPIIDLLINSRYYDSNYSITYTAITSYLHSSYAWLTVIDSLTSTVTKKASIPPTMAVMLTYLIAVKDARDAAINDCCLFQTLDEIFEDASDLFQIMRERVCSQNTVGLSKTFADFYTLTHNFQPYIYINTNAIIPAYDFTAGCPGNTTSPTGTSSQFSMRATPGQSSFVFPSLAGLNITSVIRSGLQKGITSSVTADIEFLQINGTTITLPTGDIIGTITLPDTSTVGELFIFVASPTNIQYYSLRPTIGVSIFTVVALAGKNILSIARGGLLKALTPGATSDTEFLQLQNNIVTLPTGDRVQSVTLPDTSVVGELFLFTINTN